jgi:PiT family inorganic phosphate transporter
VRGGIWAGAALVALSDGTNDGQKAMGLVAGILVASGSLSEFAVPTWTRAAVAVVLALGTVLGGRRLVKTVGRGFYRGGPMDSLGSQASAAGVIFGAGALGFPVSTSTVVASGVVGAGLDRRPRHVRWHAVAHTLWAWVVTVPACIGLGALFFLATREIP